MLKELKKCQSIKEICQTISDKQVENGAGYLLIIWAVLPIWIIISRLIYKVTHNATIELMETISVGNYTARMSQVAALSIIFLLMCIVRNIYVKNNWFKYRAFNTIWNKSYVIFLVWMITTTCFSVDITLSLLGSSYRFEGLYTYFAYAAIFFIAQRITNEKSITAYFRVFSVVSAILGVCVIIEDADLLGFKNIFVHNRAAVFTQFNHCGRYLCMAILCTMGLILFEKNKKWTVIYVIMLTVQLYSLFVNNTFGAYLGLLFGVIVISVVIFVLLRKREDYVSLKKRLGIVIGLFLLTSTMSWMDVIPTSSGENLRVNIMTLFSDIESVSEGEEEADTAGTGRFGMWKVGIQMVPKSPIVGYGLENLDPGLKDLLWIPRVENEYLQCAIFMGIPGLLIYLVMLISLAIYSLRNAAIMPDVGIIAAMCMAGHMCTMFFGNSMYFTTPYFYIFLGLTSGAWVNRISQKKKE